jgi:hypothetical protein
LLRTVFEVEACVSGTGDGTFVDYLAPLHSPRAGIQELE